MILHAFICFSVGLTLAYATILALYLYGWRRLPASTLPDGFVPHTRISVLIPARNEAQNIGACLESIFKTSYPPALLEILVVNDFSEDNTTEIVLHCFENQKIKSQLIHLAGTGVSGNSPAFGKKKAIEAGITAARGELIVTTDADCRTPPDWLLHIAALYETRRPRAIAGPVQIDGEHNALQRFQALDLAGMMGITGGGIALGWQHLGNGANLAYPKAVFEEAGGFAGNAGRASGDDLFLLQKIARRWPGEVAFLKNAGASVRTTAPSDWRSFFQQRLRWGTKNAALPETPVRLVLAIVFLFCCSILLGALLLVFCPALVWLVLGQLAVKALADYVLLREMCGFFKRPDLLRWFWPSFFRHTGYIVYTGVASLVLRRFEWKGRVAR